MSFDAVRSALDVAMSAYSATQVAYGNSEFKPTLGTLWYRATFMPGEPTQATLGTAGKNRLVGIYQVDVFAPTGTGVGAGETAAEGVITAFKRGKTFVFGGVTTRVEKVWREGAIEEDDWFHIPVKVMWFADAAN